MVKKKKYDISVTSPLSNHESPTHLQPALYPRNAQTSCAARSESICYLSWRQRQRERQAINGDTQGTFHWGFPSMGGPQNGWFRMENPIKMDDLGHPHFWKPPM